MVVHLVLSLLGFKCALDKEKDFAPSADLLGVTVDLSDPSLSQVRVGNKLERCAEVSVAVDEVIHRGALKAREVLCDSGGNLSLRDVEIAAFGNLQIRTQSGIPRTISASPPEGCICVFTDAA